MFLGQAINMGNFKCGCQLSYTPQYRCPEFLEIFLLVWPSLKFPTCEQRQTFLSSTWPGGSLRAENLESKPRLLKCVWRHTATPMGEQWPPLLSLKWLPLCSTARGWRNFKWIIPRIVNLHLKQPSQWSDQVLPLLHLEHPRWPGQGGEGSCLQLRPGRPLWEVRLGNVWKVKEDFVFVPGVHTGQEAVLSLSCSLFLTTRSADCNLCSLSFTQNPRLAWRTWRVQTRAPSVWRRWL